MTAKDAYKELTERCHEVHIISSAQAVLGWDERTYMPRMAARLRSEQVSYLSGLLHDKFTDPRIGELLSELEQSDLVKDPDSIEAANIRELRGDYDKFTKLPKELVQELSKTTSLAQGEWVKARQTDDFKTFQPWLEKVINLTIKKAEAYGYEGEPYNALMDDYERGMTVDEVSTVFAALRDDLVELLGKIKGGSKRPDPSIVERDFDVEMQRIFGESVTMAMGYNYDEGRLDITEHPFTTGIGPGDTRITTHYNPKRLNDALFGTIHEAGHALYEMGIEKEKHQGMPVGESTSLGIHESQSRMWENQVGRSKQFWTYFFPQAQRLFRDSLGGVKLDDFYTSINNVAPSYIRIEADEVTYNLHILLRFELERALTTGDLKVADLPGEWNRRFKDYFGIEVDKDPHGCLQDVHWSAGLIGYFPTYSLGNLYSAMFFDQAKEDIPDLLARFERGDFLCLREWLRENIHRHGRRYRANKLAQRVTGQSLSHKPMIDYLTTKFGDIYGF